MFCTMLFGVRIVKLLKVPTLDKAAYSYACVNMGMAKFGPTT